MFKEVDNKMIEQMRSAKILEVTQELKVNVKLSCLFKLRGKTKFDEMEQNALYERFHDNKLFGKDTKIGMDFARFTLVFPEFAPFWEGNSIIFPKLFEYFNTNKDGKKKKKIFFFSFYFYTSKKKI